MTGTTVSGRFSRVMFGRSRVDITPPDGIYHGLWGAAPAHAAAGVHRRLYADILTFKPCEPGATVLLMCLLDHVNLEDARCEQYRQGIAQTSGIPAERIILTFSHTHASGFMNTDRLKFPGGEKIIPYLDSLQEQLEQAATESLAEVQMATITYAQGQCTMAANRDYRDEERDSFVCGYNPAQSADETVLVARATDEAGSLICTLIHYGCHPTTLAWQNELISPDYVGATRELVEQYTGVPCVFIQGACGDQGPRYGFVGKPEIADQNGRWLGFSALAVLESMGPPGEDYHYVGPVVSGATVGIWEHRALAQAHADASARFDSGLFAVMLPLQAMQKPQTLAQEIQAYLQEQAASQARGDLVAARDCGAKAERARRWLQRLEGIPNSAEYRFSYSVFRIGDAIWIATGGEPYASIQSELRRIFPQFAIIFSPLCGAHNIGYLLPEERYGIGLYQEETSILAAGSLEILTEAIAESIWEIL